MIRSTRVTAPAGLDIELGARLADLEKDGLRRSLKRVDSAQGVVVETGGRLLVNFSSNDYLGLASEPFLAEAARKALERFGTGSGASRLISGSLAPHAELEGALARWKGAQAALAFSSGYAAALGAFGALVGKGDVVILDKLCHACIVDGARLSGAVLRVFPHNNLERLEELLSWARRRHPKGRVLVATESVFSMDGDLAPLKDIVALKDRFGAWLFVDEAHAVGVFGRHGSGLVQQLGLAGQVEVQMGTLGKALGSAGGYICGSRTLVDWLVNRARAFVFSTAPPPAVAVAGAAAVAWMSSTRAQTRRRWLVERMRLLEQVRGSVVRSPIVPVHVGDARAALELASRLAGAGFWIPAIRYPTVPRGTARLRISLSALHKDEHVLGMVEVLRREEQALAGVSAGH